jgi:FAD-linked oxidoreductase
VSEWRNWSGLESARPTRVEQPADTAAVVAAVERARAERSTVKMVGTGHSFTAISAPEATMLTPGGMRGILAVDREAMTVTALAGTQLKVLNAELERLGLSLHNMGDIAEQTLAGATSTGTHGTGGRWASLSAQVAALELVAADGSVHRVCAEQDPDLFAAARVGLGALGIITAVTFMVEPAFTLDAVEEPTTWEAFRDGFDEMVATSHHAEGYWFPHTDRVLTKRNNRTVDAPRPLSRARAYVDDELLSNGVFGLLNKVGNVAPPVIPALNRVAARVLSARTYSDVSHRVFTSPRRVVFREMEYALPRDAGLLALDEARQLIERSGWRISFPVEIRQAPADDAWLSTAHERESLYLAFHMNAQTDHTAYFRAIEEVMRAHDGRPHWGKLHTRTAQDLAASYPRFEDFMKVRDQVDPDRVFTNRYLDRVLGR